MRWYLLRVGLVSGLVYGVITTLIAGVPASHFASGALARGAVFGLVMAGVTAFIVRRAGRDDARPGRAFADGAVALPVPVADAMRLCTRAGAALDRAFVLTAGDPPGHVRLYVPPSMRSYGERVDLVIAGHDDGRSTVSITSRSATRYTVVDLGRNAANVRRLEAWLDAAARGRSGP